MKDTGVWIDTRTAYVIPSDATIEIKQIPSNVEEVNAVGGYGSGTPYLSQDAVSTSKITERKKQQLKSFFKQVMEQLTDTDNLYIMGPGETRKLFGKAVDRESGLKLKTVGNDPADSITQNQMRAMVREFFTEKAKK